MRHFHQWNYAFQSFFDLCIFISIGIINTACTSSAKNTSLYHGPIWAVDLVARSFVAKFSEDKCKTGQPFRQKEAGIFATHPAVSSPMVCCLHVACLARSKVKTWKHPQKMVQNLVRSRNKIGTKGLTKRWANSRIKLPRHEANIQIETPTSFRCFWYVAYLFHIVSTSAAAKFRR